MRRSLHTAVVLFCLAVLYSCQKEASFETGQRAVGSLQSDAGDCLPKNIKGTYKEGQALGDSNYIEVTVDFTQAGVYTIHTDTVNGYSFRGTGTVSAAGASVIRLTGSGTPVSEGTDDFIVTFDSSSCAISVDVQSSGSSSGGSAVFGLSTGTGSACTNSNVAGTYTQGTALTSANKVTLNVDVTTIGTWTMTTTTVSGMSFSGSGTFTATGAQTITLQGSGTPSAGGSQVFSVTAGSTNCTFSVSVTPTTTPPPVVGDHFILTTDSWVSYATPFGTSDTLKRTVQGNITFTGGYIYKAIHQKNTPGAAAEFDDSLYVRKSGDNYYEFNYADIYTDFYFDSPLVDSILFLKENLTTGQTWSSREYSDAENGVPVKLRYDFKCDEANGTVTVNGKTYNNVHKITLRSMKNENNGGYQTNLVVTNYYAAGIGWIYQKYDDGAGGTLELPARFYRVF